jgi:hypothetical protein
VTRVKEPTDGDERSQLEGQDLPDIYCTEEQPDGDFDNVADADPEADFAISRDEVRLSRT